MKTVAIIPAGGSGHRMQSRMSKQYLLLNGLPLLVHTLRRFQKTTTIDAIYLVVPSGDQEDVRLGIIEKYGFDKVTKILPGGRERQDSVRCGIDALDQDVDIVVIHDGVRPFVSEAVIRQTIAAAMSDGAAVLGVPAKETVKICKDDHLVAETLNRSQVWLIQTPQTFRRELIVRAYDTAFKDSFYGTDDAGLVERIGSRVRVIPGSYDNIKITTPGDLVMAEQLIQQKEWS